MRTTFTSILLCLLTGVTLSQDAHGEETCPQAFLRSDVQAAAAAIVDKMMVINARWTSDGMKLFLSNGLAGQAFNGLSRNDIYRNTGGERGNDKLAICFPKFRNALNRIEQKEKANNDNRLLEQQKIEAERNKPINVLLRSYAAYIYIRKCQLDRQGYLSVNVSDEEIDRAKTATRNIEQKMIEADSNLDKNALWKEANKANSDVGETDRDQCQQTVRRLENTYKTLSPEAKIIRKDF
jgi:hypothetical protein